VWALGNAGNLGLNHVEPRRKPRELVRILLIEDSPKTESFVWAALCQRWWGRVSLECKSSLSQALDSLKRESFDLILVDLAVPDLRSPNALERVAAIAKKMPVILLITQEETDRLVSARSLGIRYWVRKETLTVSRLADEVGNALEPPQPTTAFQ